jgi:hypothetical protein
MPQIPPNFALLDMSQPEVAGLVAAMVQARDAVERRSWSHPMHTVFAFTALTEVKGLDRCQHAGPSIIDFETLKSRPLPIAFLRGVGLLTA